MRRGSLLRLCLHCRCGLRSRTHFDPVDTGHRDAVIADREPELFCHVLSARQHPDRRHRNAFRQLVPQRKRAELIRRQLRRNFLQNVILEYLAEFHLVVQILLHRRPAGHLLDRVRKCRRLAVHIEKTGRPVIFRDLLLRVIYANAGERRTRPAVERHHGKMLRLSVVRNGEGNRFLMRVADIAVRRGERRELLRISRVRPLDTDEIRLSQISRAGERQRAARVAAVKDHGSALITDSGSDQCPLRAPARCVLRESHAVQIERKSFLRNRVKTALQLLVKFQFCLARLRHIRDHDLLILEAILCGHRERKDLIILLISGGCLHFL